MKAAPSEFEDVRGATKSSKGRAYWVAVEWDDGAAGQTIFYDEVEFMRVVTSGQLWQLTRLDAAVTAAQQYDLCQARALVLCVACVCVWCGVGGGSAGGRHDVSAPHVRAWGGLPGRLS